MQSRPIGLSIFAIAAALVGLLALIGALGWWSASETLVFLPRLHGIERLMALVLLVVGVLELILAYGLLALRSWAWPLGVTVEIVALALGLLQLGHGILGSHLLTIVLAVITLWYLFTPRVRAALGA